MMAFDSRADWAPDRSGQPPTRVLFLGLGYAGHRTRYLNLRANASVDSRIDGTYHEVDGWVKSGWIERVPLLPNGLKGRARAVMQAGQLARLPRPDIIWTPVVEALLPHLWAQRGALRRPLVLDLDCTVDQLEDMAPFYFGRPPRDGLRRSVARSIEQAVWRSTSLFVAWSQWTASAIIARGIPSSRVRVLPPGVSLDDWQPRARSGAQHRPLRLLFVGADFRRKGGEMLLEVVRAQPDGRCVLDIVTREHVTPSPGVRVHRAEPNSPLLRELYAQADLFVLPTQAECFGIAAVEALASGLPVVMSDIGGARDIVDPGETGWLIQPSARELARVLELAIDQREFLPAMGRRARKRAEERFDGRRNDRALLDLLVEQASNRKDGAA